jgi:hypothetical protein
LYFCSLGYPELSFLPTGWTIVKHQGCVSGLHSTFSRVSLCASPPTRLSYVSFWNRSPPRCTNGATTDCDEQLRRYDMASYGRHRWKSGFIPGMGGKPRVQQDVERRRQLRGSHMYVVMLRHVLKSSPSTRGSARVQDLVERHLRMCDRRLCVLSFYSY